MDFAVSCPLVRHGRLLFDFCPSTRTFVPCFLRTSPRGDSPCIITRPSPPSGRPEDFHLQVTEHAQHTTDTLARHSGWLFGHGAPAPGWNIYDHLRSSASRPLQCGRSVVRKGKNRRAWDCGKAARWKSRKADFPTALGNPAKCAGFPLFHRLGGCGRLTKTGHFNLLPTLSIFTLTVKELDMQGRAGYSLTILSGSLLMSNRWTNSRLRLAALTLYDETVEFSFSYPLMLIPGAGPKSSLHYYIFKYAPQPPKRTVVRFDPKGIVQIWSRVTGQVYRPAFIA